MTCSNVEIILGGNNYQAHRLKVLASEDGRTFKTVKQLVPARQGWQNTDSSPLMLSLLLPPVTSVLSGLPWEVNRVVKIWMQPMETEFENQ